MEGSIGLEAPRLAGDGAPPRTVRWRLRRPDDSRNPMPTVIEAAYEQPLIRQTTMVGSYYLVTDPEGVKRIMLDNVANYPKTDLERRVFSSAFGDGLISSDGEVWRAHRRIMAPSFSPASVAACAAGMAAEAVAFQSGWDAAPADQPVDVARDMTRLTLKIISRAMFSSDGEVLGDVMERAMADAMTAVRPGLADFVPLIGRLTGRARERRMRAVFAELDAAVSRLIAARRSDDGTQDLLARLIAARDDATGAGMSAKEVRDQVLTIFIAGHETTAAAMAWIWYLLSQHPDVEAKLHAELDRGLAGRAPTAADLPTLVYARMVVEEAMRFYPPAPGTSARVARQADEICGVPIPKGAYVVIAPWVSHRHRRLWDQPERFDPERFSKSRSEGRHRFAYIPFGAGPRVCIGASLAMTEITIILATLAQRYRLTLAPGHDVSIQHSITMRPKGGLPMFIRRR